MFLKNILKLFKLKFIMNELPLVVILGPTGSGKTKLSLELAKKFNGEIINSDSMQIYKGLDIITAKATKEELLSVPHHLIDILEPHELFTVYQYKNRALKIINDLLKQSKLPIVVGGTNYYIEALLWKILVDDGIEDVGILPENEHELPSEILHEKLKLVDPESANRLHPNNKRKIIRALEVYHKQGRKLSDILEEQRNSKDGSQSGGGLRFLKSLVFWLKCDQATLDKRLDDRVDIMLQHGLLKELTTFHKKCNERRFANDIAPDYTKGIFQSIGLKEFHSYLMLHENERNTEQGNKELESSINQLKLVTRRYARRQNNWVKNRFLGRIDRPVPPVYNLDTTDISKWSENVAKVAEEILSSVICETECQYKPLEKLQNETSIPNTLDETHVCETCNRTFVGTHQWMLHLSSNKHKKIKSSRSKKHQDYIDSEPLNKKLKT